MTFDLNSFSMPVEYIPFCCVGFIVVLAIVWGGIKVAQSLAPRKQTIYYKSYPFNDD